jgi:curved DNA-binding protein CbpA
VEARRAFRRRYHPDRQTDPAKRQQAEEIFKRAEEVFDSLEGRSED